MTKIRQTSVGQFLQIFVCRAALSRGWLVKEETSAAKWPQQIKMGNLGDFFSGLRAWIHIGTSKAPQGQIPSKSMKPSYRGVSRADLMRNLPTQSCRPESTAKAPLLKRSSILWNAPAKSPIIRDAFTNKKRILDSEEEVVFSLPVDVNFYPCTMPVFITNQNHGIPVICWSRLKHHASKTNHDFCLPHGESKSSW